jgi:tetratricopeptide (TPR) repeat protein
MRNARVLLGVAMMGLAAMCGIAQGQERSAGHGANEIREHEQAPNAEEKSLASSEGKSGGGWWKLALMYQDAARFGDAERAYGKALELMKTGDPVALANVMDCMGTMYVQMGRFDEAERLERKALKIRQEQRDPLGVGLSWMHLAMLSLGKHENADGEMYAELAVERLVPENGESGATDEQKMTALTHLSLARCAARDCRDAMSPLKRALTIAEASYAEKSFPVSYVRFLEGYVDWKRGDDRAAAKLMKSGTEGMEAQLGWAHPTFASAMRQYEGFLTATRRTAEAAEVREKMARFAGTATMASAAGAGVLPR